MRSLEKASHAPSLREMLLLLLTAALTTPSSGWERWAPRLAPPAASRVAQFRADGHAALPALLQPALAAGLLEEALEVHRTFSYEKGYKGTVFFRASGGAAQAEPGHVPPFDRLYNLEERSPRLRRFVESPHLAAHVAAFLGERRSLRLYSTSLFLKEPGDSAAQWHKDIDASPIVPASPWGFATLWLALDEVSPETGALRFASKSHADHCTYFDCHLPCETVDGCYNVSAARRLRAGDATLHTGHTFHFSLPNRSEKRRVALTVAFVDAAAEVHGTLPESPGCDFLK